MAAATKSKAKTEIVSVPVTTVRGIRLGLFQIWVRRYVADVLGRYDPEDKAYVFECPDILTAAQIEILAAQVKTLGWPDRRVWVSTYSA